MKTIKLILFGIAIIAASTLVSCTKEKPGTNDIFIQSSNENGFNPTTINVAKGTTITWTNKTKTTHTVTSDSIMFDSGDMGKDLQFSYTFTTAGSFSYHCKYHTMMKGTVVVN